MDVRAQIKILLNLQDFDGKIIGMNKKLKELPDQLAEITADVTQLQALVTQERSELEQEDKWKSEKEEEHQFIEAQIGRLRKQMQEARGHRETMALQRQLDSSRKQSSELEDEILQMMNAVEARRAAIGDHEASLQQLKDQLAKEEEQIKAEMESLTTELEKVTAERDKGTEGLDPDVKKRYTVLSTRRHPSIVEAIDGHCCGCNIAVQPQLYNTLFYANSMEYCPLCQRMIYLKSAVFGEPDEQAGEGA
ncbi:MAG: C4-type zinc ribbon domain-containing protein [bacterium]